jgi:hypothetical protein
VFENRALMGLFGRKSVEVIGGLRKLHNEELQNLYASPSVIRMMRSSRRRWAGHIARMMAKRKSYTILLEKPERRRDIFAHHRHFGRATSHFPLCKDNPIAGHGGS